MVLMQNTRKSVQKVLKNFPPDQKKNKKKKKNQSAQNIFPRKKIKVHMNFFAEKIIILSIF